MKPAVICLSALSIVLAQSPALAQADESKNAKVEQISAAAGGPFKFQERLRSGGHHEFRRFKDTFDHNSTLGIEISQADIQGLLPFYATQSFFAQIQALVKQQGMLTSSEFRNDVASAARQLVSSEGADFGKGAAEAHKKLTGTINSRLSKFYPGIKPDRFHAVLTQETDRLTEDLNAMVKKSQINLALKATGADKDEVFEVSYVEPTSGKSTSQVGTEFTLPVSVLGPMLDADMSKVCAVPGMQFLTSTPGVPSARSSLECQLSSLHSFITEVDISGRTRAAVPQLLDHLNEFVHDGTVKKYLETNEQKEQLKELKKRGEALSKAASKSTFTRFNSADMNEFQNRLHDFLGTSEQLKREFKNPSKDLETAIAELDTVVKAGNSMRLLNEIEILLYKHVSIDESLLKASEIHNPKKNPIAFELASKGQPQEFKDRQLTLVWKVAKGGIIDVDTTMPIQETRLARSHTSSRLIWNRTHFVFAPMNLKNPQQPAAQTTPATQTPTGVASDNTQASPLRLSSSIALQFGYLPWDAEWSHRVNEVINLVDPGVAGGLALVDPTFANVNGNNLGAALDKFALNAGFNVLGNKVQVGALYPFNPNYQLTYYVSIDPQLAADLVGSIVKYRQENPSSDK